MAIHPLPLILASASKSRESLLKQSDQRFKIQTANIDEKSITAEIPVKRVIAIAKAKAEVAATRIETPALILAADTVIILNNKILEKPKNKMTAVSMLKELSGSIHTVLTGWAVLNSYKNTWHSGYSETYITFRELAHQEIVDYVNSNPVTTWSGAYNTHLSHAINFVTKVEGSLTGLNGLPLDQIVPVLYQEWAHPYKKREKGNI